MSTISELTSLVREQKARLTELSRSKFEQMAEWRDRVQQLEAHLDEARRRMIQFELLKKEHGKLQAALHAQVVSRIEFALPGFSASLSCTDLDRLTAALSSDLVRSEREYC